MEHKTNYLALEYKEPGAYIPAHDPSYTNPTLEKALAEAHADLARTGKTIAIYKLVAVLDETGMHEVK
jgi:hypothetical protein